MTFIQLIGKLKVTHASRVGNGMANVAVHLKHGEVDVSLIFDNDREFAEFALEMLSLSVNILTRPPDPPADGNIELMPAK